MFAAESADVKLFFPEETPDENLSGEFAETDDAQDETTENLKK